MNAKAWAIFVVWTLSLGACNAHLQHVKNLEATCGATVEAVEGCVNEAESDAEYAVCMEMAEKAY